MGRSSLVPVVDDKGEVVVKPTIVQVQADLIASHYTFIQFRNKAMVMDDTDYPHFVPLNKERFDRIFYSLVRGQTRSRVSDVYAEVCNAAQDFTGYDHLILFGRYDIPEGKEKPDNHADSVLTVWDTHDLQMASYPPNQCVWRSPFAPIANEGTKIPFILELACGDPDVYDDIMQSIAPMIMARKPDGVIWWIGDGANGKSTLMDALYRLFPNQLSSLTVKRLVDGRDLPALNGTMANIVKESSEGRIDDTEIYKSLGTHESFNTHKFHSQEPMTISGNLHHIFSGNSVPVFNDKGYSARRRTHIIPFNARFVSDPTFEERTFTPEFFGKLVAEMMKYANKLKRNGYRYNFSAKTMAVKEDYDTEANNAEEYANQIVKYDGVVAFDSFQNIRTDYETWCAENGYVALGVGYMRRAILACGYDRRTARVEGKTTKRYMLATAEQKDLQQLGGFRLGLYTFTGFEPIAEPEMHATAAVPSFHEPRETELDNKSEDWS